MSLSPRSKKQAERLRAWTNRRREAIERDGNLCRICGEWCSGDPAFTEVHHRLPKGRGGTDELENLLTLCAGAFTQDCHGRVHANRDRESYDNGWLLRSTSLPCICDDEWNHECEAHGVLSDWWNSPEQVEKRVAASEQLKADFIESRKPHV